MKTEATAISNTKGMKGEIPGFVIFIGTLVIAAVIISFMFMILNNQKDTGTAVVDTVNDLNNQLQEYEWTQYDGIQVSGSEVFSVIKRLENSGTYVKVKDTYYLYADNTLTTPKTAAERTTDLKNAKKRSSATYINPNTKFWGKVYRSPDTDAIMGLEFTTEEGE